MMIRMFKSKIHRATVTDCYLHYEGSLTIDEEIMEAAKISEYEGVYVWNINNGSRLLTYAISGDRGTGVIGLNGSAARLGHRGDLVIISTFSYMTAMEAKEFKPTVVLIDSEKEGNVIKEITDESGHRNNI